MKPETETRHHDQMRRSAIFEFLRRVVDRIDDILDLMDRFSRYKDSDRQRLRELDDLPAAIDKWLTPILDPVESPPGELCLFGIRSLLIHRRPPIRDVHQKLKGREEEWAFLVRQLARHVESFELFAVSTARRLFGPENPNPIRREAWAKFWGGSKEMGSGVLGKRLYGQVSPLVESIPCEGCLFRQQFPQQAKRTKQLIAETKARRAGRRAVPPERIQQIPEFRPKAGRPRKGAELAAFEHLCTHYGSLLTFFGADEDLITLAQLRAHDPRLVKRLEQRIAHHQRLGPVRLESAGGKLVRITSISLIVPIALIAPASSSASA